MTPSAQPIINVAFYSFFHGGGIGQYTHELLKHMALREDVNVRLFCPPNFEWLHEATYPVHPILFRLTSPVPLFRRMRFLMGQFISPNRFLRSAGQTGAQVLHFSNINHFSYPFWQNRLFNETAVMACTAHDVKRAKAILSRPFETGQLQSFYRDCGLLFVHSDSQRNEMIHFSHVDHRSVIKVPHGPYAFGIKETLEPNRPPSGISRGLFFGNIRDEKNLDGLLKAMASAKNNIHLTIAGKPANAGHRPIEFYRTLARQLNIDDRINWLVEHVADERVATLFHQCDWVALPYKETFSSQSGVFNIATHFHKPMLLSPAPTFEELLRDYPIGVMAKDFHQVSLVEALNEISQQEKNTTRFDFTHYLQDFTWERNAAITSSAYANALKNRS